MPFKYDDNLTAEERKRYRNWGKRNKLQKAASNQRRRARKKAVETKEEIATIRKAVKELNLKELYHYCRKYCVVHANYNTTGGKAMWIKAALNSADLRGVVACKYIPKGIIIPFDGLLVSQLRDEEEFIGGYYKYDMLHYDLKVQERYRLQVKKGEMIYGASNLLPEVGLGSFINRGDQGQRNNCELIVLNRQRSLIRQEERAPISYVRLTRDTSPGEWLTVAYGNKYGTL